MLTVWVDLGKRTQLPHQRARTLLMLRNMLDTNLCIRVLRDRPAGLGPRFNAEAEALCISTITLTELLHGAAPQSRGHLRDLLPVLSRFRRWGRFTRNLEPGALIRPYDILIAGHARSLGLVVIAGNLGEFRRISGRRSEE
jgi:tRNA(fMet)-specific endonuclease VapC